MEFWLPEWSPLSVLQRAPFSSVCLRMNVCVSSSPLTAFPQRLIRFVVLVEISLTLPPMLDFFFLPFNPLTDKEK